MALQVGTIVSQPFDENTYIVWKDGRNDALVIDPGLEPEAILEFLEQQGLVPAAILNTHGHADHIGGNEVMKKTYPQVPLVIGEHEAHFLTDAWANLSAQFGMPITSPPADRTVAEGEVIEYAGIPLEVRHIPGHSPGHVVFISREESGHIFGGDVLFRGGVGRFDFPGGSQTQLFQGIREKLFTLEGRMIVYPGHGPVTTIEHEKRTNPYLAR